MARIRTRLALLGSAAALTAGAALPSQSAFAVGEYQWVALGDSYTAGVIRAAGDTFEVPRDGCERTDRSYPQVIDRDLGGLFDLSNVSCGAATIDNVTDTAQEPIGRHFPPLSEDPDYPFPAVPPQSQAVDAGADVITVGVGGNTLGFADLLTQCMQLGGESGSEGTPCKDALAVGIPTRLTKVRQDYDRMLTVLHERAPKAKILAVGYPAVIPDDASKCTYGDLTQFATITHGDLAWLRKSVLEPLNQTINDSTGTQDTAGFVDLYTSSRNHSVCDATKWVEGIVSLPDQISLVHPNALGHRNTADHVEEAMLNAIS
ncbi:SGNH/GDSL hydrolase family protein [Streptomyces sp. col6]|uniref:SGNH/GDSL hydrolase family protein n=1 Tax=Streptomyces sp. col6 TaxID=2478958 RepID=UPI0011CE540B|nr:SGNH/GDSL hydrolase family protein [Streptomyces sp. col6]TXR99691.1 SGNH/GDSL hydrolase family protein [Streptomyces sp. col6]